MRRWLWQHPFLSLGLCTLLLFFAVEALQAQGATDATQRLAGPMRVLIIPMYLVWLLFTMLNVSIVRRPSRPSHLRAKYPASQTRFLSQVGASRAMRSNKVRQTVWARRFSGSTPHRLPRQVLGRRSVVGRALIQPDQYGSPRHSG
jgi:hypothetical protein